MEGKRGGWEEGRMGGREEERWRGREVERRGGRGEEERWRVGRIKIFKYFVHNPDLKELNKLRTRIIFFLKLDNGKSGLSP